MSDAVLEIAQRDARMRLREIFDTLPASLSKKERINETADLLQMPQRRVRAVWYGEARGNVLLEFMYQYQAWRDRAVARESSRAEREYVELTHRLRALEERLAGTDPS